MFLKKNHELSKDNRDNCCGANRVQMLSLQMLTAIFQRTCGQPRKEIEVSPDFARKVLDLVEHFVSVKKHNSASTHCTASMISATKA